MRKWIYRAFTRTVVVPRGRSKRVERVEIPPSEALVYGIYFAILSLGCLMALELIYLIVLGSFSQEIFQGILLVISTLLGFFFGAKS